jgi:hypothetical protein
MDGNKLLDTDVKQETLLFALQALFEVFFRVLKHCSTATSNPAAAAAAAASTAAAGKAAAAADDDSSSKGVLQQPWPASKVHRKFPLLQPALEGLGRYSHLISVEYFNDLMAVLQEVGGLDNMPSKICVACMWRANTSCTCYTLCCSLHARHDWLEVGMKARGLYAGVVHFRFTFPAAN